MAKLLAVGSQPISDQAALSVAELMPDLSAGSMAELGALLEGKNGFYAFESALHVLSSNSVGPEPGLDVWNDAQGWRQGYGSLVSGLLFFAQDLFANQFCLGENGVCRFEPESGAITLHADSVEAWAQRILEDYNYETGWEVGREWQRRFGPLPRGTRLLPRRPFLLGGEYEAENLVAVPSQRAMAELGRLYRCVRDLPDGAEVQLQGWLAGWSDRDRA